MICPSEVCMPPVQFTETLGASGKTLRFWFFVIRVYDEKLGHILEPLVAKYRPNLFARLRDIDEKQVPANLKPIVGEELADNKDCRGSGLYIIARFLIASLKRRQWNDNNRFI